MTPHAELTSHAGVATPASRAPMWWKELRKNAMAQVSLVFVVVIIAGALFVPLFDLLDPESPNYRVRNMPPVLVEGGSWAYPLGTDYHGRNILARILYGARISLSSPSSRWASRPSSASWSD